MSSSLNKFPSATTRKNPPIEATDDNPTQETSSPVEEEGQPENAGATSHASPEAPEAQESQIVLFDNPVEEQLEAVSREGFSSLVALRVNLPQDEIIGILQRPVEIHEDDTPEDIAAKERTAEMKAAALEYIASGGTFNQFLRDCQAEATEARETVTDVREEMKRILREQGAEAAQAYLDAQNPRLRELGLPEVHIGKGLLRMAGRQPR